MLVKHPQKRRECYRQSSEACSLYWASLNNHLLSKADFDPALAYKMVAVQGLMYLH